MRRIPRILIQLSSRRSVSTNLASAFNKLHLNASSKQDSQYKRTGLFGIDQLQGPDGFHALRDDALERANLIVNEIVQCPAGSDNVVSLFDELSNCLCKVADLAEFIRVGHPQPRFRATAEQASIAISTLVEQLNTDRRLYDSLKKAKFNDALDEHVAKLFLFDFEQCAINLDDDRRKKVLQLNESILKLGSIFAANANQGRLVKTEKLPQNIRHLFPNNSGKTLINGLHADSDNEQVREFAYKTYLQPDKTQDEILTSLLRCRQDLAQICGFESYAHRAVKGSIAGSPEVVNDFLDLLNDRIRHLANRDYDQMLQLKIREQQRKGKGDSGIILNAWDVPYYSANFKRGAYNESVLQSIPYFSIGVCMDGLNLIFNELYGVRMQVDTCQAGELWHNDVIKLSIIEEESNELLGHIYCDLFERPMKQHQDCHHTIRGGCYLRDGTYQLPIVVLVLSLPDSNDNDPALLTPSMVDNLFHEMGHAMHSMMARTKYQHITGTRCSTDLAEVPSILMEFFASDPRVLSRFARHHATGQPMPEELMTRWIKSKKVFTASETQLQVFYAALDQAYHSSNIFQGEKCESNTTDILARIQSQYYSIPYVENTAWQLRFSHLVGYGAKYYSYLVSRAVASAIWTRLFAENPLSRSAGQQYREQVLAPGGGKPAQKIAEDVLACRVDADFIARSVVDSFQQPLKID
uniref:Mitochondrial intermediate peptidase n=1 Tax=Aceria tosichella TaxID=561515 RepID=A0A6G1S764_9ACAR